jgi:hypothetical protein
MPEMTDALIEGSEKVNTALAKAAEHEAVPAIARSLRERVTDVLKALGREYESRAYRSLLELYGPELGAEATQGLRRLIKMASEGEIDALLQRLLARKTPPAELLRALGKADEALIADLVKTRQLAELGVSRRLLALLTQDPDMGAKLLRGPFKSVVGDLESFLGRVEPLPADARESVLRALLHDNPLPADLLLGAAKQVGVLDEPTLALLRRLQDARIRTASLFDGSGPSLKKFAEQFSNLTEGERVLALRRATGRPPTQVIQLAEKARQTLKAVARDIAPTAEQLDEDIASGARKGVRARVRAHLREPAGPYQTALLDTVLEKNVQELARMREELKAFAPDAILGAERSGPFIADAAASGEPALVDKIIRVAGANDKVAMAMIRSRIKALIAQGKRRFAFTEAYFTGGSVNILQNDVIIPLAKEYPECQFKGLWLRESLGFEAAEPSASSARQVLVTDPRLPSNVSTKAYDVPFAIGDDAKQIIESTVKEPIYIFNSEGKIVKVVEPQADDKTTRDVVVRLLGGKGGS